MQSGPKEMTFFVTSAGPGKGGDLGGLDGADRHCQSLAQAAGGGPRTWRAYLSTQAATLAGHLRSGLEAAGVAAVVSQASSLVGLYMGRRPPADYVRVLPRSAPASLPPGHPPVP